ncbi:MAG: hypothetical protein C0600_11960 [Ignavibacteria bacterium]|nr:MAG: hypothetical protein C0600_11960 [Ignavibacteria bacterium]
MKKRFFSLFAILPVAMLIFAGCSSDAITDSLFIQYGDIKVSTEKTGNTMNVSGTITVRLINRTEKQMNVGFLEGEVLSAASSEALLRFRPIIPDSYGSISTVRLLPKETREVPVVMPIGLPAFDANKHPQVIVGLSFQTTDGYRTDVKSQPVTVTVK